MPTLPDVKNITDTHRKWLYSGDRNAPKIHQPGTARQLPKTTRCGLPMDAYYYTEDGIAYVTCRRCITLYAT